MIALVAALALGTAQGSQLLYLGDPQSLETRSVLSVGLDRLDPPKLSPKRFGLEQTPWEFDWAVAGLGRLNPKEQPDYVLRLRVFSQLRRQENDLGVLTARMIMRLWEHASRTFQVDHSPLYNSGIIDVYLCWGGEPGSEQAFAEDRHAAAELPTQIRGEQIMAEDVEGTPPRPRKVNTVYIYDLASFANPIEMAREVAHEYGHAILPPIGGFGPPEEWGNGDIGERIFLRHLRNQIASGKLKPADAMNASLADLDGYLRKHADPLVLRQAANGPERGLLKGPGQDGVDSLAGLASYMQMILPPKTFIRSMILCGPEATSYPAAIVTACREMERVVLDVPPLLKGKDLWLPLADGKLSGGNVLKRSGDWAQVRPLAGALTLTLPPPSG